MPHLIDFSAIAVAAFAKGASLDRHEAMTAQGARHMILQSLVRVVSRHARAFPETILCFDWSAGSWRKDVFPHYKANRKKGSEMDWDLYREVRDEMTGFLCGIRLWRSLLVEKAEADDLIASAVLQRGGKRVLIASGDKDFRQLWVEGEVDQWNPRDDEFIRPKDGLTPDQYLRYLLLAGDRGDGVPNFMAPDDVFVSGGRSPSLFQKKVDVWLAMPREQFMAEMNAWPEGWRRGLARNARLINLRTSVPKAIQEATRAALAVEFRLSAEEKGVELKKIEDYCDKHQLFQIRERIAEFAGGSYELPRRRSFEDMLGF